MPAAAATGISLLTDDDVYFFNEGTHSRLYERLGAHVVSHEGTVGTVFAVWAPNSAAGGVSVIGDFNGWQPGAHPLQPRGHSGIHEGFIPGVGTGTVYKFHIHGPNGVTREKADPFGFFHEVPPRTASVVHSFSHRWGDGDWMAGRAGANSLDSPISIYELHVGSWLWVDDGMGGHRPASWRELAPELASYVRRMGFTHVELMPVTEHPFGGSWGYQSTGYFAPTSRFGTPDDFAFFVDTLHQAGIGVILDWVPSHFPNDAHGLFKFDGTHLYEHADPRKGYHPDWHSAIFNYDRHEVRSFLISSALFWLDRFHIDGLRVDAVASMLYLDYSRQPGEWIPNEFGGRENLGAIQFLRQLNAEVYRRFPDVQTIAEESTAWPMVSRPTYIGGLGFGFKWDMGWMHDSLSYFSREPVHRRFHQNDLTFRQLYAFTENFMLPLSHDEVVHGKGSLVGKMPGDEWQRFANLRLLFAFMFGQPGKKLLFMGGEIGQYREWDHDSSLDWHLLQYPVHDGVRRAVADLNRLYRTHPALHSLDCRPEGFAWIDCSDADQSVIAFKRSAGGADGAGEVVCVFNFTPVPRHGYRIGVPAAGFWREIFNSDSTAYAGSGVGNLGGCASQPVECHGHGQSVSLTLPPLGAVFLQR